ncbi:MAG: hypothetical protein WDW36_008505 [Sanguina aurantia]
MHGQQPTGLEGDCLAHVLIPACSQLPGFLVGAVLHTDIASQASFLNGRPGARAAAAEAETRLAHTQSRRSLFADSRPSWDVPSPLPWS